MQTELLKSDCAVQFSATCKEEECQTETQTGSEESAEFFLDASESVHSDNWEDDLSPIVEGFTETVINQALQLTQKSPSPCKTDEESKDTEKTELESETEADDRPLTPEFFPVRRMALIHLPPLESRRRSLPDLNLIEKRLAFRRKEDPSANDAIHGATGSDGEITLQTPIEEKEEMTEEKTDWQGALMTLLAEYQKEQKPNSDQENEQQVLDTVRAVSEAFARSSTVPETSAPPKPLPRQPKTRPSPLTLRIKALPPSLTSSPTKPKVFRMSPRTQSYSHIAPLSEPSRSSPTRIRMGIGITRFKISGESPAGSFLPQPSSTQPPPSPRNPPTETTNQTQTNSAHNDRKRTV